MRGERPFDRPSVPRSSMRAAVGPGIQIEVDEIRGPAGVAHQASTLSSESMSRSLKRSATPHTAAGIPNNQTARSTTWLSSSSAPPPSSRLRHEEVLVALPRMPVGQVRGHRARDVQRSADGPVGEQTPQPTDMGPPPVRVAEQHPVDCGPAAGAGGGLCVDRHRLLQQHCGAGVERATRLQRRGTPAGTRPRPIELGRRRPRRRRSVAGELEPPTSSASSSRRSGRGSNALTVQPRRPGSARAGVPPTRRRRRAPVARSPAHPRQGSLVPRRNAALDDQWRGPPAHFGDRQTGRTRRGHPGRPPRRARRPPPTSRSLA